MNRRFSRFNKAKTTIRKYLNPSLPGILLTTQTVGYVIVVNFEQTSQIVSTIVSIIRITCLYRIQFVINLYHDCKPFSLNYVFTKNCSQQHQMIPYGSFLEFSFFFTLHFKYSEINSTQHMITYDYKLFINNVLNKSILILNTLYIYRRSQQKRHAFVLHWSRQHFSLPWSYDISTIGANSNQANT